MESPTEIQFLAEMTSAPLQSGIASSRCELRTASRRGNISGVLFTACKSFIWHQRHIAFLMSTVQLPLFSSSFLRMIVFLYFSVLLHT
jgi:hypothetical protein